MNFVITIDSNFDFDCLSLSLRAMVSVNAQFRSNQNSLYKRILYINECISKLCELSYIWMCNNTVIFRK